MYLIFVSSPGLVQTEIQRRMGMSEQRLKEVTCLLSYNGDRKADLFTGI